MTIKEALEEISKLSSPKEATILLSHILNCDTIYLILNEKKELKKLKKLDEILIKLKQNTPIEYITNKVSFYSQEFFIGEGALIPRPETEILIDEVLKVAKNFETPRIAEIGIGSGIISIILALNLPTAHCLATDISFEAIKIAKINMKKFEVENRIKIFHSSYLDGVAEDFDIIVSNPPYVANNFKLEKKLSHEPQNALFGGEIGDEILKNIIDLSYERKTKYLICEMGYDQKEKIENYLKNRDYEKLDFYKDLAGIDRGFILKL